VRRIEAVTAGEGYAYLHARARELDEVRAEAQRLRKGAKQPPAAAGPAPSAAAVEPEVTVEAGVNVIVQAVDGIDADSLLDLSDRFKQQHPPAAVVLASREDGKVHLVANFDDSVAGRISAADVVRRAASLVGGGGGGRPTMARAGGKDAEKVPEALAAAQELIVGALR
jgi:alanyl-tRNA synthetase